MIISKTDKIKTTNNKYKGYKTTYFQEYIIVL